MGREDEMKQLLKRKEKLVKPLLYLRLNIQMHDHCYWDFRDLCMSLLRFFMSLLRAFFYYYYLDLDFLFFVTDISFVYRTFMAMHFDLQCLNWKQKKKKNNLMTFSCFNRA